MEMPKAKARGIRGIKIGRWFNRVLHLSGAAVLCWSVSIWLMVHTLNGPIPEVRKAAYSIDFESLLFGAASVAVITYSLAFGVVAFFGYDIIKKAVQADIMTSMEEKVGKLENL